MALLQGKHHFQYQHWLLYLCLTLGESFLVSNCNQLCKYCSDANDKLDLAFILLCGSANVLIYTAIALSAEMALQNRPAPLPLAAGVPRRKGSDAKTHLRHPSVGADFTGFQLGDYVRSPVKWVLIDCL